MKYTYIIVIVFLFVAGFVAIGGNLWIGGDNIPNQFLLEYIFSSGYGITNQRGLPGPATGLAMRNQLPYALLFRGLHGVFGSYADSVFFGLYLVVFFIGWQKLFFSFSNNKPISYILPFVLLGSPYFWLLIHRNVLFQLILLASIPRIIITIKGVFDAGKTSDRIRLLLVLICSSGGFQNPGYAIPTALLILFLLFTHNSFTKNIVKFLGVISLGLITLSPTIFGQINLLLNSKNLSSDYWNTKVLTEGPLHSQKHTNTIKNVIVGYNSDTNAAAYGYMEGDIYHPWRFAPFSGSFLFLLLYVPVVVLFAMLLYVPKGQKQRISILLVFLLFLVFMMKSSAGPGGDFFYNLMMNSGIMKMFRSPHAKFGFVYSIVLCYIIALGYGYLKKKEKTLTSVLVLFFAIYGVIFFVYPSLLGSYIPKMQKVKNIPNEYSAVRDFLQLQTSADLGMLLPFNESTWDSNTWGYEGYHILHWMNTGVSFWNRNGLSFNSKNKIGHEAGYMLSDLNSKGFQLLRNQGYDIIVYDQSSSRDERFGIDENHISNIGWLLSQQQYISKIYSTGSLTVFSIK